MARISVAKRCLMEVHHTATLYVINICYIQPWVRNILEKDHENDNFEMSEGSTDACPLTVTGFYRVGRVPEPTALSSQHTDPNAPFIV